MLNGVDFWSNALLCTALSWSSSMQRSRWSNLDGGQLRLKLTRLARLGGGPWLRYNISTSSTPDFAYEADPHIKLPIIGQTASGYWSSLNLGRTVHPARRPPIVRSTFFLHKVLGAESLEVFDGNSQKSFISKIFVTGRDDSDIFRGLEESADLSCRFEIVYDIRKRLRGRLTKRLRKRYRRRDCLGAEYRGLGD